MFCSKCGGTNDDAAKFTLEKLARRRGVALAAGKRNSAGLRRRFRRIERRRLDRWMR